MNLQEARNCSRKATLNESLTSGKNKFSTLSKVIHEVIKSTNIEDSVEIITKNVENAFLKIGTEAFSQEFEVAANAQNIVDCLDRYLTWERKQGGVFIKKGISNNLFIPSRHESVDMYADLLIDRGNEYHLVKFFRGKPILSYRGKTINTNPVESVELYCLQLLGESLGSIINLEKPDKPIIPCFYYLKSKSDKNDRFMLEFESKKGENIVSHYFTDSEKNMLSDILKDIEFDISNRSENNCSDCTYNDLCNLDFVKRDIPKEETEKSSFNRVNVTTEQEKLIMAREGHFCVNAVAGSGKTTVIALRTLALLEEEEDPQSILMITFTEKAKIEMSNKIKGYYKAFYETAWKLDIDKINIETFNSWGQKIISKHYEELGFSAPPHVIDDLTKRDIIITLLEALPKMPLNYEYPFMDLPYSKGAVIEMGQVIDKLKAADVKNVSDVNKVLSETLDAENKWYGMQSLILNFYNEYNQELREKNKIDFEDQLRLLGDLKPFGVLENLPYKHIIIDEFQDSNPNQLSIIEDMLSYNTNIKSLVVVGDTMQAIYSFRNTSPENLINFGKKLKDTVNINLTQNFRSDRGIIEWANRIIKREAPIPKYMRAFMNKSYQPIIETYESDEEAEEKFLGQISEWIKKGVSISDIAVLARSRKELVDYQKVLVANGYEADLKVPEIVKDNPYIKGIFSLVNYLLNTEDIKSLSFYAKSKAINPFVYKDNVLVFNKIEILTLGEEIKGNILSSKLTEPEKINAFFTQLEDIAESDYIAKDFINRLIDFKFPTLNEILSYIRKYNLYEVKDSFNTNSGDSNAITLITVHSAKGLEYPNVILLLDKFKETSEEKRLFYVGITRAKKELLVLAKKKQKQLIDLLAEVK